MKKITVLGGGTGAYVVLSGLKNYSIDLGVIVSMMDSGGSTGRLRDQLGVLPPGDLRQCLVALSDAPDLWRKLFLYRFKSGDLAGHNFGNIFLSALEKVSKNYEEVLETASYVLKTKGEVIPITHGSCNLCVMYEDGKQVVGEAHIEENIHEKNKIIRAFLKPSVYPTQKAMTRINQSDYLIVGPGDLFTSIIPLFLVSSVKEAIMKSPAKIIYIMNLMTKSGQTADYTAQNHINDLIQYMGKAPQYIIINNGKIPLDILEWYKEHNESPVIHDLGSTAFQHTTIIEQDLINRKRFVKDLSDATTRSILRHDETKLAEVISKIIV